MIVLQVSYSFDFDFGTLIIVLVGLTVGFILLTFPYRLLRVARSNGVRKGGERSPKRTKRELRKMTGLIGELLLFPVIGSGIIVGVLMAIHSFIIPIPLVVDVASMFSSDTTVWEERTETGELGDVGRIYGEWSDEQGFSQSRAFGIRKFMKRNWYMVAALGLIAAVLVYLFFTGYYVSCLEEYKDGLLSRRKHYAEHDGLT